MAQYDLMLKVLRDLPPERQQLMTSCYWSDALDCGCVLGTIVRFVPTELRDSDPESSQYGSWRAAVHLYRLHIRDADELVRVNDTFRLRSYGKNDEETRKARFVAVLASIEQMAARV